MSERRMSEQRENDLREMAQRWEPEEEGVNESRMAWLALKALDEIASLRKALPDPDKLELLASWLDIRFPDDPNPEIQRDLREWAKAIRKVQL